MVVSDEIDPYLNSTETFSTRCNSEPLANYLTDHYTYC
jgi:hypothetical protein